MRIVGWLFLFVAAALIGVAVTFDVTVAAPLFGSALGGAVVNFDKMSTRSLIFEAGGFAFVAGCALVAGGEVLARLRDLDVRLDGKA